MHRHSDFTIRVNIDRSAIGAASYGVDPGNSAVRDLSVEKLPRGLRWVTHDRVLESPVRPFDQRYCPRQKRLYSFDTGLIVIDGQVHPCSFFAQAPPSFNQISISRGSVDLPLVSSS
jgi:hypothetical protein